MRWGRIVSVFSDGMRKIDALRKYGVTKDGNTKSLSEIRGFRFVTKEEYFSFREYKKFGKDHGFWHLTDWEADEDMEDFLCQ